MDALLSRAGCAGTLACAARRDPRNGIIQALPARVDVIRLRTRIFGLDVIQAFPTGKRGREQEMLGISRLSQYDSRQSESLAKLG